LGGIEERIAKLAVLAVQAQLTHEAERKAKATRHAERTAKSTETKQQRASAFWGNQWLSAAHQRNTKLGAGMLALAARNMIEDKAKHVPEFKDDDQYKHRGQINVYRASLFLHRPPE
jgi:hypothetical protein